MPSCILFQNTPLTIVLLDIPRSLELAQDLPSSASSKRLISSNPLEYPYSSIEPKSAKAKANLGNRSLEDLLLQKHLEFALDELKVELKGPWCLPRVTVDDEDNNTVGFNVKKWPRLDISLEERIPASPSQTEEDHVVLPDNCIHFHNSKQTPLNIVLGTNRDSLVLPPKSTFLQGDITKTLSIFTHSAPKFDLIVLDPPWPNRSARRKQSYSISYGNPEIKSLLSSIPLYDHLAQEGLIAVWVTNKPAFREMLLKDGGLFDEWGIQLVEEWIWLKVTSNGELICALDSRWRKPYEILLVGHRGEGTKDREVNRRVIIGVPDFHSRKPNLKTLFESMMNKKEGEYEALEIFARNLTAGWWSWGNEVLKFQMEEHWADS